MNINPLGHPTLVGVDDEVLSELKDRVIDPFLDDPNAVVRRLLGLDEPAEESRPRRRAEHRGSPSINGGRPPRPQGGKRGARPASARPPRAPKGSLTPEEHFERPILEVLDRAGGSLPVREAVAAVGSEMAAVLNEHDQFRDDKGVARWEKRVPFVRLSLVRRGWLAQDTPRGVWQITDQGREALTGAAR